MTSKMKEDKRDLLQRKYSDRELFTRLIHYMGPHRTVFVVALALMFAGALLDIVQPLLLLVAIDDYIVP
ncbi:MAG: hypothetical protein ACTSP4_13710, partial [Candidatus Hodarchaeales archaeon]